MLIVDDEDVIRDLLFVEFCSLGFDVDTAANGEEALEKMKLKDYSVVISDIRMPKLSGMDMLRQSKNCNTDFIMMTGYKTDEAFIEGTKEGAFSIIGKPFNLEYLRFLVDKAVRKRKIE
jgi:DNA-binding NtrC family response regulator